MNGMFILSPYSRVPNTPKVLLYSRVPNTPKVLLFVSLSIWLV